MIYAIVGKAVEREAEGKILLENNGITYEIWADRELYECDLPEIKAFIILQPSETEWRLFGFLRKEKRQLFLMLTSVTGVGAKTAIKILYDASASEIARSILENDLAYLSSLPNVGKKTAERIVLELKTKIKKFLPYLQEKDTDTQSIDLMVFHQALEALESLGYSSIHSRRILRELFTEKNTWTVEEILKAALKKFFEKDK